jgi:hypothetical protein
MTDHSRMRGYCLSLLGIPFVAMSLWAQSPKPRTYFGTGVADMSKQSLEEAKKQAIAHALQDAVEEAVGVYVKSTSSSQNAQSLMTQVKTEAAGYVRRYDIIKEVQDGTIYKVVIEAEVEEQKIESSLSQRISQFVEQNILGPCNVIAQFQSRQGKNSGSVTFICSVNDPTLDMTSIELWMPDSGWKQPVVSGQGTINIARLDQPKPDGTAHFRDFRAILNNPEIKCRFKDPASGKLTERPIRFKGFTYPGLFIDGETLQHTQPIDLNALPTAERAKLINILDSLLKP